jgi:hypothetical protein
MAHLPVTEERRAKFLETLAETGSVSASCAAAATNSHGPRAAKQTWNDLRHRDPDFAQLWDEALSQALGRIEGEIVRRAFDVPKSPVTDRQGNVVGYREDRMSADRLLLRLASKIDPDAWAEKRKNELAVSGTIQHQAFAIDPGLVSQLPRERQEQLVDILDELAAIESGLDPAKAISNE